MVEFPKVGGLHHHYERIARWRRKTPRDEVACPRVFGSLSYTELIRRSLRSAL